MDRALGYVEQIEDIMASALQTHDYATLHNGITVLMQLLVSSLWREPQYGEVAERVSIWIRTTMRNCQAGTVVANALRSFMGWYAWSSDSFPEVARFVTSHLVSALDAAHRPPEDELLVSACVRAVWRYACWSARDRNDDLTVQLVKSLATVGMDWTKQGRVFPQICYDELVTVGKNSLGTKDIPHSDDALDACADALWEGMRVETPLSPAGLPPNLRPMRWLRQVAPDVFERSYARQTERFTRESSDHHILESLHGWATESVPEESEAAPTRIRPVRFPE